MSYNLHCLQVSFIKLRDAFDKAKEQDRQKDIVYHLRYLDVADNAR